MLELYSTLRSANGRKVGALCHQLGLHPREHTLDVYRGAAQEPAYRELHPLGQIPILVDGGRCLTESNAILVYLCEAYGDYRLWSRDPLERALIAAWLFWESSQWQPALVPVLSAHVGHLLGIPGFPAPTGSPDWKATGLIRQLDYLELRLAAGPFLRGDTLTLADLSVAGMTTYFRATHFPFDRFPNIRDWHHRIEGLDAWNRTAVPPWA